MHIWFEKFFLRVLCCFIPFQRLRRRLRGGFDRYFYYKAKKAALLAPQIELAVLGSSHAQYGFCETDRDINLGVSSQDLYYSYQLYQKCRLMFLNLKRVVLFYSDFSAGFEEERSKMISQTLKYNQYFGIPPKNPILYAEKNMDTSMPFAPYKIREFDFNTPYPFPCPFGKVPQTEEDIKTRVEKHLKHAARGNNQTAFVEKLIRIAIDDGIRLLIVVPPMTEKYLSYVPVHLNVFEKLEELIKRYQGQVLYLNCYRDKDFTSEDFADCDHLNQQGAQKLTAKIRQKFSEQ